MEEDGEEIVLEVEGEVLLEMEVVALHQMLGEEVKIRISVTQVAKDLKNHTFNAIIVRSLGIIIMNSRKKNDQHKKSTNHSSNTSKNQPSNTSTGTMFIACTMIVEAISISSPIECNVVQESQCDIWYLDSGCSNHMIGNRDLFYSLD